MRNLFIFIFFFLGACAPQVVLLQELDQRDANQILYLLSKEGIDAKKEAIEKQQEVSFTIKVSASEEIRAREILVVNQLPKQKQLGLSGICKEAGLIPTPKTEKCRELLAIKGEVINSLESIQGVISADVVLNVPDKEDFPDENAPPKRPTASVVVQISNKMKNDGDFLSESKIQQFVANAVSGMDLRDVAVVMTYTGESIAEANANAATATAALEASSHAVVGETEGVAESESTETESLSVGGLMMDEASAKKFKMMAIILLILFVVLSAGLIIVLLQLARVRQKGVTIPNSQLPQVLPAQELVGTKEK